MFSSDPEIRDQAYQFFTQESLEFLQVLEAGLMTLRADHSVPKIHALMRAAHSIKGGAASLGLTDIQAIAHRLEDVTRALYRQEIEIDLNLEEGLLKAYDCLRSPLLEEIQTGRHDGEFWVQQAEPCFAQLEELLGDFMTLENELPSSEELGIDIVHAIFNSDVNDGLVHLEQVLAHPDVEKVLGELRAQVDVFIGVGELVNLPGFVTIAKLTLTALQVCPDQVQAIGEVALANFRIAQAAILAGDRTQGGEPSDALLAFVKGMGVQDFSQRELDHAPLHDASENFLESDYSFADDDAPIDLSAMFSHEVGGAFADEVDPVLEALQAESSFASADGDFSPTSPSFPLLTQAVSPIPANPPTPYLSHAVRVDLNRLERLNNLVGELVTQENGSILKNQQLQGILNLTVQRFGKFERISNDLQDWNDRSHNAKANLTSRYEEQKNERNAPPLRSPYSITDPGLTSAYAQAEFDPLQMDSYSHLYTIMQEVMEEIAQLGESMRDMTLISQQTSQAQRKKQQTLKQVRNDLLWARMLPLGDLLLRFPRMVRDLATKHDKQVSLKLSGATTLIDKAILEKLYDPLVHLVRNAFDHGIESPEARQTQGKLAEATIEIRAYHRGNQTYIEVRDDGGGIDVEKIRDKAIALNLLSPEATPSSDRLYEFLFFPGFSTAAQVSELSGRGVGLDAVQSQVKVLKGSVTLTSELGKGSSFILRLPLTLTIARLLVFSVNTQLMAVPIDTLMSIVAAPADQIQTLQGKQYYRWEDELIPLYTSSVFSRHYALPFAPGDQLQAMAMPHKGTVPLLLIGGESQVVALQVDQILQEQELVIKPFGQAIAPPPYLYGCTILGDGSLVPVLDGEALMGLALLPQDAAYQAPQNLSVPEHRVEVTQLNAATIALPSGLSNFSDFSEKPAVGAQLSALQSAVPKALPTVLVVDDSLTARQTLAATLKKAGCRALQARDGREALDCLRQDKSVQVVFCDVEMPRMNGFEFLSQCRQQFSKTILPVIMLTSRSGEKHRQLAQLMGANSYMTKPYLEQELLRMLQASLPR
jgi:two-component system, chemotaxis family, sensor histidine kinase and response regulator PixL